jgi:hypothetical protein
MAWGKACTTLVSWGSQTTSKGSVNREIISIVESLYEYTDTFDVLFRSCGLFQKRTNNNNEKIPLH